MLIACVHSLCAWCSSIGLCCLASIILVMKCIFFQLKVYPEGIRHIRADKRVNEWRSPGKKSITRCALNERQVVISLSGGEIVYFEMDPVSTTRWPAAMYDSGSISLEWPVK